MGKTRLDLETAGRLLDTYPRGVGLTRLADAGSGQAAVATISSAMGLTKPENGLTELPG